MTTDPGDGAGRPAPSNSSQTNPSRPRRGRRAQPPVGTLAPEEQRARAHEAALRLLGVRERSTAEIKQRLRQKGYDPFVVEQVVSRLTEVGLLDDQRFAERFASEATAGRAFASRRVRTELLKKGIDRDLAAVAATRDPDEEEDQARALARARAGRMQSLSPDARARRIMSLLARRGYDADVCRRIASEVAGWDETSEE